MKRSILACLAGLLTWVIVVTVINRLLRLSLPGYIAAEKTLQFTLAMKWARLIMAIVTSVAAGAVTPGSPLKPLGAAGSSASWCLRCFSPCTSPFGANFRCGIT